jgi:hypothetical protein
MEKLLVAYVERLLMVEARIEPEPSTFRPGSPTLYQLSYPARQIYNMNIRHRKEKGGAVEKREKY